MTRNETSTHAINDMISTGNIPQTFATYHAAEHANKLTVRDLYDILGFMDVVKATTDRALKESTEGPYHDAMLRQARRIRALIAKIESIEL